MFAKLISLNGKVDYCIWMDRMKVRLVDLLYFYPPNIIKTKQLIG